MSSVHCTEKRSRAGLIPSDAAAGRVTSSPVNTEWVAAIGGIGATLAGVIVALRQTGEARRLSKLNSSLEADMARLHSDLQTERDERKAQMDRKLNAEDVLTRYREPLAAAAMDLQSRCYNIVHLDFFGKFGSGQERHDDALVTTLFRLAQYLGWTEILRREVQYLSFPEEDDTRRVAQLQSDITRRLASSDADEPLMIWADEQRAIGERMIVRDDGKTYCMGYARFRDDYDACFAALFRRTRPDLTDAAAQQRLRDVQRLLCQLVATLDPKHLRYSKEQLGLSDG